MPHSTLRTLHSKMERESTLMSGKGMRNAGELDADVVRPAVLDQQDLLVAHLGQLLHRLVLHDLQITQTSILRPVSNTHMRVDTC